MKSDIRTFQIIIQALENHSKGYNEGSADKKEIDSLIGEMEDELGDLQAEAHHKAMDIKMGEIKKECPWATDEAINDYLMEYGFEDDCSPSGFKKSLLG